MRARPESALMAQRRAKTPNFEKSPQIPLLREVAKCHANRQIRRHVATELRTLIQRHARDLSEQLQAHQRNSFPPSGRKDHPSFFACGGRKTDRHSRRVSWAGRGGGTAASDDRHERTSNLFVEDIQNFASFWIRAQRRSPLFAASDCRRASADHHGHEFQGRSGKTTTSAHLAQYLALHGYRVSGDRPRSSSEFVGALRDTAGTRCRTQ